MNRSLVFSDRVHREVLDRCEIARGLPGFFDFLRDLEIEEVREGVLVGVLGDFGTDLIDD